MPKTDHHHHIEALRLAANTLQPDTQFANTLRLASDLLEMHDQTAISLDIWPSARGLIESLIGRPLKENHA